MSSLGIALLRSSISIAYSRTCEWALGAASKACSLALSNVIHCKMTLIYLIDEFGFRDIDVRHE